MKNERFELNDNEMENVSGGAIPTADWIDPEYKRPSNRAGYESFWIEIPDKGNELEVRNSGEYQVWYWTIS